MRSGKEGAAATPLQVCLVGVRNLLPRGMAKYISPQLVSKDRCNVCCFHLLPCCASAGHETAAWGLAGACVLRVKATETTDQPSRSTWSFRAITPRSA